MSSYEEAIIKLLKKDKIKFEREKTFTDLKKGKYRYDFYIENYNGKPAIIEIQGEQHYKHIKHFHKTRRDFLAAQERDRAKISYALSHRIPIYIIPYWEIGALVYSGDIFKEKYLANSRWKNDIDKQNLTKGKF